MYYVISNGQYKGIIKGMQLTQKKLKILNKDHNAFGYGITGTFNTEQEIPAYLQPYITKK